MKRIEKSILIALVAAVAAMMLSGFSAFAAQSADIRAKVFRLHILANSDSAADQALKLKVRDRILAESGTLFAGSSDKAQVVTEAKAALPRIRKIAAEEIKAEGYDYAVHVQVTNMYFNTRTYGNVTLPAGNYDALRITIGSGNGHNWWCVLFPPLCLPSAEGEEKLEENLTPAEAKTVKDGGKPTVVVKFKTLEVFESIRASVLSWFSSKTAGAKS